MSGLSIETSVAVFFLGSTRSRTRNDMVTGGRTEMNVIARTTYMSP